MENTVKKRNQRELPGGPGVTNPPASAGDVVQSLVQEDPVIHGATKPVYQND